MMNSEHNENSDHAFDFVIRNANVVGRDGVHDIAVKGGMIVRSSGRLPEGSAAREFDAMNKLVAPGLIDMHLHVYHGATPLSLRADEVCPKSGVTTAIDTGSAGADTFAGFNEFVIDRSKTRIWAFLNISRIGLAGSGPHARFEIGELFELRYADVEYAISIASKYRDRIVGIKVRASTEASGPNGVAGIALARNVAEALELPMMVHIAMPPPTLEEMLPWLRAGDVVTHCFTGHRSRIIDSRNRVKPEVIAARERGVLFDIGHGWASFSFEVARAAIDHGFLPDMISTDLHAGNVNGPVFDMATTLEKFLALGVSFEDVVERATIRPAKALGLFDRVGSLEVGKAADIAVFDRVPARRRYVDSRGVELVGDETLKCALTMVGGEVTWWGGSE